MICWKKDLKTNFYFSEFLSDVDLKAFLIEVSEWILKFLYFQQFVKLSNIKSFSKSVIIAVQTSYICPY